MTTFLAFGTGGVCYRTTVVTDPFAGGIVEISATVGRNAPNRFEDGRTIQDALNQVPHKEGGPNPKLKVDGLCWGKTIAAIERFQRIACKFNWPDGRVDPEGKTNVRLRDFFLLPPPYTLQTIHMMLPEARVWTFRARMAIVTARHHLEVGIGSRETLLLEKYFHVTTLSRPQRAGALDFIDTIYRRMEGVLTSSLPGSPNAESYFVEDPKESRHFAYSFPGGFKAGPVLSRDAGYKKGPNVRIDRTYVCPRKLNAQPNEAYVVVIMHELAHFCGERDGEDNAIIDHSYRRRPDFFSLSPRNALRTADCYAHFAGHIVKNREPLHPG